MTDRRYDPPARISPLGLGTCPLTYFARALCEHCIRAEMAKQIQRADQPKRYPDRKRK